MDFLRKSIISRLSICLIVTAIFQFQWSVAQERFIIDNFSQPNDSTLNYYGSGDINNDKIISHGDVLRLDSLINGTFTDSLDDRLIDRADINGDGFINLQDKEVLDSNLSDLIKYLPAHWNKLNQKDKIHWFEKMLEIDKTDTISSVDCKQFANPFVINFHGFESLANGVGPDFPYKFSKNNRFIGIGA